MPGGVQAVRKASLSKYSIYKFATMGLPGDPTATPSTCSKESINIRVHNPTLTMNIGKYNFNLIWDSVLVNIHHLKINFSNGHAHRTCISEHAQSIPTNRHFGPTGHALNSEHVHRTS